MRIMEEVGKTGDERQRSDSVTPGLSLVVLGMESNSHACYTYTLKLSHTLSPTERL